MQSKTFSARKKWFEYLKANCIACSNEGGSLSDMRRSFWGKSAYVVRCNKYLFRVNEDVFEHVVVNS